jgi:hypothetical protein
MIRSAPRAFGKFRADEIPAERNITASPGPTYSSLCNQGYQACGLAGVRRKDRRLANETTAVNGASHMIRL